MDLPLCFMLGYLVQIQKYKVENFYVFASLKNYIYIHFISFKSIRTSDDQSNVSITIHILHIITKYEFQLLV